MSVKVPVGIGRLQYKYGNARQYKLETWNDLWLIIEWTVLKVPLFVGRGIPIKGEGT